MYLVKPKEASRSFNFTFRYKDYLLSLNNYLDRIYSIELEAKDTTDTETSASYLYPHLEIDSEGWFRKKNFTTKEMITIFQL
jgi:hypothetical protein